MSDLGELNKITDYTRQIDDLKLTATLHLLSSPEMSEARVRHNIAIARALYKFDEDWA